MLPRAGCGYPSITQEQKELGSDQAYGAISGSGSTFGLGIELGRIQGSITGRDLDEASQSPSYSNRPILDGPNASSLNCSKAKDVGKESGLKQGLVLRPSLLPECKRASSMDSNFGEQGKNKHRREEDVTREDPPQDDVCFYTNRVQKIGRVRYDSVESDTTRPSPIRLGRVRYDSAES